MLLRNLIHKTTRGHAHVSREEAETVVARGMADRKRLVGLIGEGITKSFTPALHEAEARRLGFDYEYRTLDLLRLRLPPTAIGELVRRCRVEGFDALNVTHPCKQLVLEHLDEVDDVAARLGAVNLVLFHDDRAIGCNVDWLGFRGGILTGLEYASLDRIVQFGAGGAGAATAYGILSLGASALRIADLDISRAEALATRLGAAFPGSDISPVPLEHAADVLRSADGVIHATPVGMAEHPGIAFDPSLVNRGGWVAEVVYRPLETELVTRARRLGLRVLDGGRMAVGQAVESLRLITGVDPDPARMYADFLDLAAAELPPGTRRLTNPRGRTSDA
jgi:shikimate dehydrogenase